MSIEIINNSMTMLLLGFQSKLFKSGIKHASCPKVFIGHPVNKNLDSRLNLKKELKDFLPRIVTNVHEFVKK